MDGSPLEPPGLSDYDQRLLAQPHPAWARLGAPERQALEAELLAELAPGHPLFGKAVTLLARRVNNDDVLGYASEFLTPWVTVHLTWFAARYGRPDTPPWPGVQFYETLDDFLRAVG